MDQTGSLVSFGWLLVFGLVAGMAADRIGLPRVAAYVLAGALFSPQALGRWVELGTEAWAEPVTLAALGVIAYLIGGSITVGQIRRLGRVILATAVGESLGAALCVGLAVWLLAPGIDVLPRATLTLALASIACTTAPAATVAVLHQYRARGPMSTALLGVVAVDDAIGIVIFSLTLSWIGAADAWRGLAGAAVEIGGGLSLGAAGGLVLWAIGRHVHRTVLRLPLLLGTIILIVGLAERLSVSPLLAAMTLGFAVRLFAGSGDRFLIPVELLEEAVLVTFFTLAGTHLRPDVLSRDLGLILVYVVARVAGKLAGAAIGARLAGAPPPVARWLGLGLVPQAGVAIGLVLVLAREPAFGSSAEILVNVILGSTVLYELIGPFCTRFALGRAGELGSRRPATTYRGIKA